MTWMCSFLFPKATGLMYVRSLFRGIDLEAFLSVYIEVWLKEVNMVCIRPVLHMLIDLDFPVHY